MLRRWRPARDPAASVSDDDAAEIRICGGSACHASGRAEVAAAFKQELAARGLAGAVRLVETGCHGFCEQGPIVVLRPDGVFYPHVQAEDVAAIVVASADGAVHAKRLYKDPATKERIAQREGHPLLPVAEPAGARAQR